MRKNFVAAALLALLPMSHGAESLALDAYRGKVVVVDFWASWCAPCRQSFPWMNAMSEKYGEEGLAFISVTVDTKRE